MSESGILREGARRVWKSQRVVWWYFFVNLVLAFLSTRPLSIRLAQVTEHSLQSQHLVQGFDLATYSELISNPDVARGSAVAESNSAIFGFLIFALFLTGGVLATYHSDFKLATSQFFEACGTFFWRYVRLFIFMAIVISPILFVSYELLAWSGRVIFDHGGPEKTGYWMRLATLLLTAFVMIYVRLWFDMAQVRALVEDERGMRHTLARSFRLTSSNFGSLFWLYFRISFLAWLGLLLGMWLWTRIPGQRSGLSFLVCEVVLLWWLGTRLWQRASEVVWYQRHMVAAAAAVPVVETATVPGPPAVDSLRTT
jgi:hypothetical protein